MRRLEHGHRVAQVCARRDADAAHFGRQAVGNVVAVQVGGGEHVVFRRAQQDLLQHRIGDDVLQHDIRAAPGVLEGMPRTAVEGLRAELLDRELVAPVAKTALGEFLDIALMHQRHRLSLVVDGVLVGPADEPLRALDRYRLDADR